VLRVTAVTPALLSARRKRDSIFQGSVAIRARRGGMMKMKTMRHVMTVMCAMAVLGTGAAMAETVPAGNGQTPDPDRRICKVEKSTGSRVAKKKTCLTSAEWAQMRRDAETLLREQRPRSRCESGPGGGVTC
jgi:hypothetical protein